KIARPVSAIPPSFRFAPAVTLICLSRPFGAARPAAPPSRRPRPLLDENHFIFSVLILATRRPPTVANRFGRAFVAAREQRRKRWQIWGYELCLAIIALAGASNPRAARNVALAAPGGGWRPTLRGAARHSRDHTAGLRHRTFVVDVYIDARLAIRRRDGIEPRERPAGEPHGGASRGEIDYAHVAPKHSRAQ